MDDLGGTIIFGNTRINIQKNIGDVLRWPDFEL